MLTSLIRPYRFHAAPLGTQILVTSALLMLSVQGCRSTSEPREVTPRRALVTAALESLKTRNPDLEGVQVLEIQSLPWSTSHLAMLARETRPGDFRGRFEDELFGVFVVDSSLSAVERVVDAIPTPRWHDYSVRFDRVGFDSLYVIGAGESYGDLPMRRSYHWIGDEALK